jgi:hypothetical protein
VFTLIYYFNLTKGHAIRDHGSQEFIVIASYVDHSCSTFGMTQYASYSIGVALSPPPLILLYLPGINNVAHQIQGFAGVMLEKVVEFVGLTISSTKMYV